MDHYMIEEERNQEMSIRNQDNYRHSIQGSIIEHIDDYIDINNNALNLEAPIDNNLNDIDFTNPYLGYEDLLRLDENLSHPLPSHYLSMLIEEKMTDKLLSHLNEDTKTCMICFDEFLTGQKFMRIPCLHLFHSEEIKHWFEKNKTCPICRTDLEELFKKYN